MQYYVIATLEEVECDGSSLQLSISNTFIESRNVSVTVSNLNRAVLSNTLQVLVIFCVILGGHELHFFESIFEKYTVF